jgi:hypothetical protein
MFAIEARHSPLPFRNAVAHEVNRFLRQRGEPGFESRRIPAQVKSTRSASGGYFLSWQATENSASLEKSGTLARVAFPLLSGPALKRSAYVARTPSTASAQAPTLAALRLLRASIASSRRMLRPCQTPKPPIQCAAPPSNLTLPSSGPSPACGLRGPLMSNVRLLMFATETLLSPLPARNAVAHEGNRLLHHRAAPAR